MSRPELAVVILNYRTPKLSADCLDSLEHERSASTQVLVVDNDSRDGSAEYLEQHIRARGFEGWARVLRAPSNGGFSAGNNLGIQALEADAYALLNSDTVVRPGALRELCRVLSERPDVGLVGPSFEDGEGRLLESVFDAAPQPLSELLRAANTGVVSRLLSNYAWLPRSSEAPLEPVWLPFACVVIPRAVIERVGLLDDGYFMYFEDVDYCLRLRAAGYKVLYWPQARVVHYVGKSSQVTDQRAAFRRGPRYLYEARSRYFAKHFGPRGPWVANLAWLAGRVISRSRELLQPERRVVRERELYDIWINVHDPFRRSSMHASSRCSER